MSETISLSIIINAKKPNPDGEGFVADLITAASACLCVSALHQTFFFYICYVEFYIFGLEKFYIFYVEFSKNVEKNVEKIMTKK